MLRGPLLYLALVLLLAGCSSDPGHDGHDVEVGQPDVDTTDTGTDVDASTASDADLDAAPRPDTDRDVGSMGDADADETGDTGDESDTPDVSTDADTAVDAGPDEPDPELAEVPVLEERFHVVRDGLYGGIVHALERSISDSDILYAGSDGGGLFRSDDGGKSWSPTDLDVGTVKNIAIDPSDPDRLWARYTPLRSSTGQSPGSSRLLMGSEDGGETFDEIELPDGVSRPIITASDGALWLSGNNSVYRSVDGGTSWNEKTEAPTFRGLTAHPTDPDTAWVSGGSSVWRTENGGSTWSSIEFTLEGGQSVNSLTVSPVSPQRLWLGVSNGNPFRSDNGGTTWTHFSAPGNGHEIAAAVEDADTIWTSSQNGTLARSDDGGDSWETVSAPRTLFEHRSPHFAPRDADEALAFSRHYEVFRTDDAGVSWQRSVDGITSVWTRSVAVSDDGEHIVVGSDHGDVFVSDDQGKTFSHSRQGLVALGVTAVAIDPDNPDVIYAGTGAGNANVLFSHDGNGAVFKSVDQGETFTKLTNLDGDYTDDIDAIGVGYDGDVLVQTTYTSFPSNAVRYDVYRSSDGGITWEELEPNAVITDLRELPDGSDTTLAGFLMDISDTHFAVSDDLGSSWTVIDEGGEEVDIDETVLALSSRVDPSVHFAYTASGTSPRAFGKYGGSSWGNAEVGLSLGGSSLPSLRQMAVGEYDGEDLLIAVGTATDSEDNSGQSIHVTDDGAATWDSSLIFPYVGIPTSVDVADDDASIGVIGLEGGRGLLITRTGGM